MTEEFELFSINALNRIFLLTKVLHWTGLHSSTHPRLLRSVYEAPKSSESTSRMSISLRILDKHFLNSVLEDSNMNSEM